MKGQREKVKRKKKCLHKSQKGKKEEILKERKKEKAEERKNYGEKGTCDFWRDILASRKNKREREREGNDMRKG